MKGITAIILTFNEEKHIARCIESLSGVVSRIVVVDSLSTDRTKEIATSLGADVYQNPFKNYATQFQWGIDNTSVNTDWTMRIDADEYIEPNLKNEISDFILNPSDVNAVYLRRKMVFLGRPIKHGFFYPAMMLRIWRTGQGKIESRWMDEHVVVENAISSTMRSGDLVDENKNDLAWWTAKHVGYAKREVYDIVYSQYNVHADGNSLSGQAKVKRWFKSRIYNNAPLSLRASMYFIYRYVLGAGFLDGREGFLFHFLQAYWYRTYVDATMVEMQQQASAEGLSVYAFLQKRGIYG